MKLKPVNTWAFSFDEPIVIGVTGKSGDTIEVYRDTTDTIVYSGTLSDGFNEITLGDAQTVLADNKLHELIVFINGRQVGAIPAKWEQDTAPYVEVNVKDENGNLMVVDMYMYNKTYNLIHRATASGFKVYVGADTFVEFVKERGDGYKYYYATRTDRFTPYISGKIDLQILPARTIPVRVDFVIQTTDPNAQGFFASLVKHVSNFALWFAEKFVNFAVRYPLILARKISSSLGLDMPILDVHAEQIDSVTIKISVVYEQDPVQVILAAIIIAAIAGVTIYIALDKIESIEQAKVAISAYQWLQQEAEAREQMIKDCSEIYANDPTGYTKCVENAYRFTGQMVDKANAVLRVTYNELNNTKKDLDKWKAVGIAAGAIAVGTILSGGKTVIVER